MRIYNMKIITKFKDRFSYPIKHQKEKIVIAITLICFLISGLMRKRNISVLGAVTMFSTSDSSSLDCFLGHSISYDIKKAKRDVATLLLHLAWLCLQRKFESGGKILNQASCDKGRSRSAHGYRCCQAQIPMR